MKYYLMVGLIFAAAGVGYAFAPRTGMNFSTATYVDLTHSFYPEIPHGPGLKKQQIETLFHYDPGVGTVGHGALIHYYQFVGQWGTHVDAPAHFARGKRTLDQIPIEEMLLPLVVIDIHEKADENPDYQVSLADIEEWEQKHGQIPSHAFVALRTDWSKRWPDQKKMYNRDLKNIAHYPGWSREVLSFLVEQRDVVAIGHETPDTDPGFAASQMDYVLETYFLSQNRYQIELMTNLDRLPEKGAMIIASWPKARRGLAFQPGFLLSFLNKLYDKRVWFFWRDATNFSISLKLL